MYPSISQCRGRDWESFLNQYVLHRINLTYLLSYNGISHYINKGGDNVSTIRPALKQKVVSISKQRAAMEKRLISEIRKLKDNPNITRINKNVLTMSIKYLSEDNILDARYYDYRWQYEEVIRALQVSPLERMFNIMEDIVNDRRPFSSKCCKGKYNIL